MRSLTSGCAEISAISFDNRATTSGGVFDGTATPNQIVRSKPGTPFSATVGISGSEASRRPDATASALSLPAATCGIADVGAAQIIGIWPASRSLSEAAAARYGTLTM